jgi:hypothetical protein
MKIERTIWVYFSGLAMTGLTGLLAYWPQQQEFWKIIGLYVPLFGLYVSIAHPGSPLQRGISLNYWVIIAIILRFLALFSMPNLSNDVYRFIWDGRLLANGYNPFDHLPAWYLENNVAIPGIDRAAFEAFGAKDTYTSYPPVAQLQFWSACRLFPTDVYGAVIVMKLWLFIFELGTIFLMGKLLKILTLPKANILWYALNPLIIIEVSGNLHFEGAMIFFFLMAIYHLFENQATTSSRRLIWAALAFSLSICSKLLTAMLLPFFIKRLGWGRSVLFLGLTGIFTILFFVPVVNATFLHNFTNSLGLYFQKLEYNACIYYLYRWAGYLAKGYNNIAVFGPRLGLLAAAGILAMAFFERIKPGEPLFLSAFFEKCLFAFCLYLACSTTVHPWYVAFPVALCVFTDWRFPVLWSGLIMLTYVNYSYQPYRENLWIVALEYLLVAGLFLWEWQEMQRKRINVGRASKPFRR